MGNERKARGRRRMGMGCLAESRLDERLPGREWLTTAAWSHTRSPADESVRGQKGW